MGVGGYFTPRRRTNIALTILAQRNCAKPFTVCECPMTDWVAHRREVAHRSAGRFFVYGFRMTRTKLRRPRGEGAPADRGGDGLGTGSPRYDAKVFAVGKAVDKR